MSKQRVLDYHLSRLDHRRADIRIEAINELVLLDHIEILDKLRDMNANDPDEAVRAAAKEAGKILFLKKKELEKVNKADE